MTNLVPRYAFFVAGTGTHLDRLHAFEKALLNAGPIAHNLVTVSSILPADCKIIAQEEGFKMLTQGAITFCVMAREDVDKPGQYASASVGVVRAKKPDCIGYLSEYHGNARGKEETGLIAKRLAIEMFETKFGDLEEVDTERVADVTASIQHLRKGWSSAVALCIFVL